MSQKKLSTPKHKDLPLHLTPKKSIAIIQHLSHQHQRSQPNSQVSFVEIVCATD